MKILLMCKEAFGAWFSLRLEDEGHAVDYYLKDSKMSSVLEGICPTPFSSTPDFSKYDLVVFDQTGMPALAEKSLKTTPTIGDGDLQSELEDNRAYGIQVMEEVGINVPPYEEFDNIGEAKRFIKKTNKKYVFKPDTNGEDQDTASTYVSTGPDDLIRYLDKLDEFSGGASFILQEVVQGTEVSTEGWFNGNEFYLINSTLEEKKFMNDGKGPNTGCSGNLVWAYQQEPALFKQGLGLMRDFLQEYNFRGMIDLNTIVSDNKIYGLEWTPRFGYDASATLFKLLDSSTDLGEFFYAIANGDEPIYNLDGCFAASVRVSIPPYPTEVKDGHPDGIVVNGIEPEDILKDIYLYDAKIGEDEELVTVGVSGFICAPIASGSSIHEAFSKVCSRIDKIKIPNMQYRTDIEKCCLKRYNTLQNQGWLR